MRKFLALLPIASLVIFTFYIQAKPTSLLLNTNSLASGIPHTNVAEKSETNSRNTTNVAVEHVYELINFNPLSKPNLLCFTKAYEAYKTLISNDLVENHLLTIVDFSLSSTVERLWVIDMLSHEVVLQSLVAHGIKSGDEFATRFSNTKNSFQSSLGVYLTGEVYNGRNGLSLRLDGLNAGYNNLARERGVVIHGANYVSESYIERNGRLGRSQGCPAVSTEINAKLIELIKDKSVLFIYHPHLESATASKSIKKLNLQGFVKRNI